MGSNQRQALHPQPQSSRRDQPLCVAWLMDDGFMVTTEENISSTSDIVAELSTNDESELAQVVNRFFEAHGGKGEKYHDI